MVCILSTQYRKRQRVSLLLSWSWRCFFVVVTTLTNPPVFYLCWLTIMRREKSRHPARLPAEVAVCPACHEVLQSVCRSHTQGETQKAAKAHSTQTDCLTSERRSDFSDLKKKNCQPNISVTEKHVCISWCSGCIYFWCKWHSITHNSFYHIAKKNKNKLHPRCCVYSVFMLQCSASVHPDGRICVVNRCDNAFPCCLCKRGSPPATPVPHHLLAMTCHTEISSSKARAVTKPRPPPHFLHSWCLVRKKANLLSFRPSCCLCQLIRRR